MNTFYFGCWNQPGHYFHAPGGHSSRAGDRLQYYGDHIHLDGTLTPRILRGVISWQGKDATKELRTRFGYDSEECPQGQYLVHHLTNGYTAVQWWDRNQGDKRGACNSTILLEGEHSAEAVLAAGREHFPHVFENLDRAGVKLVDVTLAKPEASS